MKSTVETRAAEPVYAEPLFNLSKEVQAEFERIGTNWHREPDQPAAIIAAYAPFHAAADKSGIAVHRDLPYGSHPRQVVDVFAPEGVTGADVVLFVHGGAYARGAKRRSEEVYDNVLYWFARHGVVGINVEYRLSADAPYPGGAQDIGSAVLWAKEHAAEYGGNPGRIFVIGHSAGATHVVGYAFDPAVTPRPGPEVAGIISISGRLRADTLPGNPNAKGVISYFGSDPATLDARSPLTHAASSNIPIFIAVAQYENPYLDVYGAEFFYRVSAARDRAPRFIRMRKHNHTSIVAHFNTGEEILGREILDFMAKGF